MEDGRFSCTHTVRSAVQGAWNLRDCAPRVLKNAWRPAAMKERNPSHNFIHTNCDDDPRISAICTVTLLHVLSNFQYRWLSFDFIHLPKNAAATSYWTLPLDLAAVHARDECRQNHTALLLRHQPLPCLAHKWASIRCTDRAKQVLLPYNQPLLSAHYVN